ncbi:MAG: hypothetical protein QXZ31_03690 [Thermofilaceae archaeon]
MRIVVLVIGLFALVIAAYLVDVVLTAGKLVENVLEASGIPAEEVQGSPESIGIQVITVALLVLSLMIIFHIINSIRKKRGA